MLCTTLFLVPEAQQILLREMTPYATAVPTSSCVRMRRLRLLHPQNSEQAQLKEVSSLPKKGCEGKGRTDNLLPQTTALTPPTPV